MSEAMDPGVINGITEYDEVQFVSTGRYQATGEDIEVIEVIHRYKLPHLGDRWPVFTRIISYEVLNERRLKHETNPEDYIKEHMSSL